MEPNNEKIDEAALGLLWLTLHDQIRAWKGLDWDIFGRLHEQGLIHDPVNKSKSVAFTQEGMAAAKAAYEKHFTKPNAPTTKPKKPSRLK